MKKHYYGNQKFNNLLSCVMFQLGLLWSTRKYACKQEKKKLQRLMKAVTQILLTNSPFSDIEEELNVSR